MDRALLDTDILSELMRRRNAHVVNHAAAYRREFGRLTITTLSIVEIVKGLVKAGRDSKIDAFLRFAGDHEVLTLDAEAASLAGRAYARLEAQGISIGRIDPLIAAIAMRHGCELVAGNSEHYQRLRDLGFHLSLADWRDASQ